MTTATKITLGRLCFVPFFVAAAIFYGQSIDSGEPDTLWRWIATALFLTAAIGDWVDGYVARKFNQESELGIILDPVVDKCLLIAAVVTLCLVSWPERFPLWFALLIVIRDLLAIASVFLIKYLTGTFRVTPHWTGKCATVTQMVCVGWFLVGIRTPDVLLPIIISTVCTCAAISVYFVDGIRQLQPTDSET